MNAGKVVQYWNSFRKNLGLIDHTAKLININNAFDLEPEFHIGDVDKMLKLLDSAITDLDKIEQEMH